MLEEFKQALSSGGAVGGDMKHKVVMTMLLLLIADSASAQYVIGDTKYTCQVGAAWNDPRCIREPVEQGTNDSQG